MADGLMAVTGASGVVGGTVAELLAARGITQRLVVRDPAPRLPGLEGVRRIADYGHADDVRRALDGIDTLCLVPAQESADRLQRHFVAVDAAAAAGVRKITYLSFRRGQRAVDVHPSAGTTGPPRSGCARPGSPGRSRG